MPIHRKILDRGVRADHAVMHRVNRWRPARWLRRLIVGATRGGDGWLWLLVGCVVEVIGGPTRRYLALASAALAILVGVALFLALKRAVRRRRPRLFSDHPWYSLLPPDQFSFPSGHTITAFSVAFALGAFYPGWRVPLVGAAAAVGASRVLLGLHFLTDVLAGVVLGAAVGLVSADLVTVLARL